MAPPNETQLTEMELSRRISSVELDVNTLKNEMILLRTETLAQYKNIVDTLQVILKGESASCMRHDARIAAVELSTAAIHALIVEKADKALNDEIIGGIKRNLAIIGWVGGIFIAAMIGAFIKHMLG